jgi:hypothetical protein
MHAGSNHTALLLTQELREDWGYAYANDIMKLANSLNSGFSSSKTVSANDSCSENGREQQTNRQWSLQA